VCIMFWKKKPVIVAHSTRFHADDLFAVAVLLEYLKGKAKVIRSIDPAVIAKGDYVVDIGRVYDPAINRFDHHQGGIPPRPDGVGYASVGLVWKHFGEKLAGSADAAKIVDESLIESIDAFDTGDAVSKSVIADVYPYDLNRMVGAFNNSWEEEGKNEDEAFMYLLPFARALVRRAIIRAKGKVNARGIVRAAYDAASDKRIVLMDKIVPAEDFDDKSEVLFIVSPETRGGWCVRTVRKKKNEFINRKDLPLAWAGKSGADMAAVSGVPDATFCHLKLFLAVAKSKEGALALAQKALVA
jgi:uncharacterized UPF0160 family protein